jgi:hypothetical protein
MTIPKVNLRIVVDGATVTTESTESPDTSGIDWMAVIRAVNTEQVPTEKRITLYMAVTASLMFQILKGA